MISLRVSVLLIFVVLALGCTSAQRSAAQLDDSQTRIFEADRDVAFLVALHAVLDSGYIVDLIDSDGGTLVATRRQDPGALPQSAAVIGQALSVAILSFVDAFLFSLDPLSPDSPDFSGLDSDTTGLVILVTPEGSAGSRVRAVYFHNQTVRDSSPQALRELWALMSRQLLMREPPPDRAPEPADG